jgi:penicillin-binding protein 1A
MKFFGKLFRFLLVLGLLGGMAGVIGLAVIYKKVEPELPSVEVLKDVRFQVPLRIYSRDGKLLAEYGEKRRIPLQYEEIPQLVLQAFLAAEDDRFFEHPGVDYQGLLRAAAQLVLTGERRQGGSTITMQVARNFFLSREKTYIRKLKEIFLSLRIERDLSKEEILTLYLNKIYLGNRAYGIGAAAQVYYGRTVAELDLPQLAMIAGLPKAPSTTNPIANPQRAQQRRNYVLARMRTLGFIDDGQFEAASNTPVSAQLHRAAVELQAPYLAEMVRAGVVEQYGEEAYTRGFNVTTTVDSRLQQAADTAVRAALQSYDQRHGYRGAAGHKALTEEVAVDDLLSAIRGIAPVAGMQRALVMGLQDKAADLMLADGSEAQLDWRGMKWASAYRSVNSRGANPKTADDILKPGDLIYLYSETDKEGAAYWRLAQVPAVEGALVSIDPDDGALQALTGGYDYYLSKFNRAVQAKRQPGSGFKAFIYSAALEAGYTPASLINDAPLVVQDASLEGAWRPENYSGKWFGPTRLRVGLYKSRNLISIRLLRAMGVKHALTHAQRFGFDPEKLPRNLSLALGSGEVSPWQMARGYAVLANGGFLVEPYYIERIEEESGELLFQAAPLRVCEDCPDPGLPAERLAGAEAEAVGPETPAAEPARHAPRVLDAWNQYLMTSMMKDVIRRGTGTGAKVLGRNDLAGKTGTSNEQRDAWFNGFNRRLVTITWVGFDSFQPLGKGEVGGKAALPAWIDYMRVALDGVPEQAWEQPEDIVTVKIDPTTGKRAAADSAESVFEVFREGKEPEAAETPAAFNGESTTTSAPGRSGESLSQELF